MKAVFEDGYSPKSLLNNPGLLRIPGKLGENIKRLISEIANQDSCAAIRRAKLYISNSYKYKSVILTYKHPLYPKIVFRSNYPVPILYARGNKSIFSTDKTVACVGSRKIRLPYSELHREFAQCSSEMKFTLVSGFALGADKIGHEAVVRAGGYTICVMAGGLDRPFPPENKQLWEEFLNGNRAVFVSESPFGGRASGLTLRKRNKLIVAFSLGVLVSQSGAKGGAMNAFRFCVEQHKPVATFSTEGTEDTSGNELISACTKVPVATFKSQIEDRRSWSQWLQKLLFSI
jgi:DNA protecting protein DprA